jgi:hypothetical protein
MSAGDLRVLYVMGIYHSGTTVDSVTALADMAGWPTRLAAPAGPVPDRTVTMNTTHTVGGNNNRFRTGPVQLREDTEWRSRLYRLDRAAVTTVCSPLMAQYGYRLVP